MPTDPLDTFLAAADTPDVDLGAWLLHLMARDRLVDLGRGRWADGIALAAPHACTPAACTPGRRAPRHRSCCADLEVTPSPEERARIEGVLSDPLLADDPRWAGGPPPVFDEEGALRRPGRRCVFARPDPDGLRCALHTLEDARGWPRGRVKPMPCRLFPLAVVALDEGVLLTAVHRRTARGLGARPAAAFPCLHREGAPPLYVSERATIEALFGRRAWGRLADALGPGVSAGAPRGAGRPGA